MTAKRYHVLIDVSGVDNAILNDEEGLSGFLKKLPGMIGMSVLKGPEIAVGIPENPGLSGFVIIDYSHISIHTFTNSNEALVDIFSCKPYNQEVTTNAVLDYFKTHKGNSRIQIVCWE